MIEHVATRREFLRTAAAGAAGLGLGSLAAFSREARANPGPNVLFIAVDDLNDWTGFLGGHPDAKTPNLDRLAARGTAFTHAYCPAPLCNASRAALMTGVLPSRSGVYVNAQDWRENPVLQKATTLPQHFMAHGYKAMGSGKIYHGGFPHAASWDEYWPSQEVNRPNDPEPPEKPWRAGPAAKQHFDWGGLEVEDDAMSDSKVADWVIGQLKKDHEKPFFLACGIFRPHLPWYVPQKYFDMYPVDEIALPNINENDLDDVPEAGRAMARLDDHHRVVDNGKWREAVQAYLACITFADACVGRVLDALETSAYRDNTLVVLWSDHGWHLGEKLHWRKFALWEEATHNVLLFAGPGIAPGQRSDAPVNLLDIYPTLIDCCGLGPREGLDGVSLKPLLDDPNAPWERPSLTTYQYKNHALRTRRWRYIQYEDGSEELYDHSVDDLEWTNLAADPAYEDVKRELREWLPKTNVK